jgi:hypothetical protein
MWVGFDVALMTGKSSYSMSIGLRLIPRSPSVYSLYSNAVLLFYISPVVADSTQGIY